MIRKDYWSYGTRRETRKRLVALGRYKGRATGLLDSSTRRALEQLATGD